MKGTFSYSDVRSYKGNNLYIHSLCIRHFKNHGSFQTEGMCNVSSWSTAYQGLSTVFLLLLSARAFRSDMHLQHRFAKITHHHHHHHHLPLLSKLPSSREFNQASRNDSVARGSTGVKGSLIAWTRLWDTAQHRHSSGSLAPL